MKRCPRCQRAYEDALGFCLDDGAALGASEARCVADLIGPAHSAREVRAVLASAARALDGFDRARLAGVLLPEDLELASPDLEAPRILVSVDLETRRRDDPAAQRTVAVHRAPESVRGDATDDAAIVYGLGCVGYALATGHAPFAGNTPAAIQVRKLLEAPPRADTDDDLAALLLRAMSQDPSARPSRAEFALVPAMAAPAPVPAMAAPAPAPAMAAPAPMAAPAMAGRIAFDVTAPQGVVPKRSRARWLVAALGLVVVLGLASALVLTRAGSEPPRATSTVAAPTAPPVLTAAPPPPVPMTAPPQGARGPIAAAPPSAPIASGGGDVGSAPETPAPEGTPPPPRAESVPEPAPPPAATVRVPRRDDVTPWVLIGAGVGVGAVLAGVLARRRRRRDARAPVVTTPTWVSAPPRPISEVSEAFAHTMPDARSGPITARRCPSCAQSVPDDARFCPFDGATITGPVAAHSPSTPPRAFLVGPYECIEPLGEGGMGVVYRARHVHLDRPAAVKVLLPGAGLDEARVALFRREARLAASVQHPNSVLIYDFGEIQGAMLYLAMELVEGRTLDAVIDGRPMAPTLARRIALQIGDGLDAAHRVGIVHRDLKPANVMVCGDDAAQVKIVDFGIARAAVDPRATEAGRVMGTLPYMAPEQARGEATVDARADVFSFGVVAYEMLTGALPFDEHTKGFHAALLLRVTLDRPPPSVRARAPGLPLAVDDCLRRALHPERERRTASAGAFARELAQALTGS